MAAISARENYIAVFLKLVALRYRAARKFDAVFAYPADPKPLVHLGSKIKSATAPVSYTHLTLPTIYSV